MSHSLISCHYYITGLAYGHMSVDERLVFYQLLSSISVTLEMSHWSYIK